MDQDEVCSDDEYVYEDGYDECYGEEDEDNMNEINDDYCNTPRSKNGMDLDSSEMTNANEMVMSSSHQSTGFMSNANNENNGRRSSFGVSPDSNSNNLFTNSKGGISIPEGSYIVTEYSVVAPLMEQIISEVSNLLAVDGDVAHILLQHSRWNKEKLLDSFFADPEKLMADCGLDLYVPRSNEGNSNLLPDNSNNTSNSNATFCCRICCDDEISITEQYSLGCGHKFCRPCYTTYLVNQIRDGPACIKAHCPFHQCTQAITRSVVKELLLESQHHQNNSNNTAAEDAGGAATATAATTSPPQQTYKTEVEKYERYCSRNFIETCKYMKYCPSAGCDRVVVGSAISSVKCTHCLTCFCFRCGEESHAPASCSQLVDWCAKCANESETANWIIANTKKCPACKARIEKNQGCNHMSCKLCKHEFCWICMGSWAEHGQATGGFYKCNRYDPSNPNSNSGNGSGSEEDNEATIAERAKRELERYLHYYQRYHAHDHSLKFAASQRELAERRMVEQQEVKGSSWIDVQFLKQAAEQVIDCRRVLKYTYVLGYYMTDGNNNNSNSNNNNNKINSNNGKQLNNKSGGSSKSNSGKNNNNNANTSGNKIGNISNSNTNSAVPVSNIEKQLFEHHQEMLEKNTERLQEYTEQSLDNIDRTQVVNLTRVTEKFMMSLLTYLSGEEDTNLLLVDSNNNNDNNNCINDNNDYNDNNDNNNNDNYNSSSSNNDNNNSSSNNNISSEAEVGKRKKKKSSSNQIDALANNNNNNSSDNNNINSSSTVPVNSSNNSSTVNNGSNNVSDSVAGRTRRSFFRNILK